MTNTEDKMSVFLRAVKSLESFMIDSRSSNDTKIFLALLKQYLFEESVVYWPDVRPLGSEHEVDYEALSNCDAQIDEVLKHVCIIKLNGGLGTTMGCCEPKSKIVVRDGLSFLDFAIKQNEFFNSKYKSNVPLILMNSFNTDSITKEMLNKCEKSEIRSFLQSKCPRIDAKTLSPIAKHPSDPNPNCWYPPGHGNIFQSMHFDGILDELLNAGRDICFISNVDNIGATLDLRIANYMHITNSDYLMECTQKTLADIKGGTLIEIDGRIMHLEMPQVPEANAEEFRVKVARNRFLPVKKAQDLLAVMSNIYEIAEDFSLRLQINRPIHFQPIIKLSKHFDNLSEFQRRFKTIPSIHHVNQLFIDGDVYFGDNVTLKGCIVIVADDGYRLDIPNYTTLENKLVKGRLILSDL